MPRSISRTKAFRTLQKTIGGATLHLNTVAVGLELIIPKPVDTPSGLHISWSSPETEMKRRELAAQARTFVLRSVLVAACDALDAFLIQFARTEWLVFSQTAKDKATKATTAPGKKAWSIEDRLSALADDLTLPDVSGEIGLMSLAARWRNAIVHTSGANFKLEPSTKSLLESQAARTRLSSKANFDCKTALAHFLGGKPPTLKEVTTILAFMQDLCRKLDEAAIQRAAGTVESVESLLITGLRGKFRSRGQLYEFWGIHRRGEWRIDGREPPSTDHEMDDRRNLSDMEKAQLDIRSAAFATKWSNKFGNLLSEIGFVETKGDRQISAVLCDNTIKRFRNMSACEFADAIGIK